MGVSDRLLQLSLSWAGLTPEGALRQTASRDPEFEFLLHGLQASSNDARQLRRTRR